MSISINSMNSVLGQSYNGQVKSAAQSTGDSEASKEVDKIREQMRALENELLQMKSDTDASEQLEDTKEQLEDQLEELRQQLKTAEAQAASSTTASTAASIAASTRPRFDKYEKGAEESQPLGIYTIKPNGERGYDISYEPYSEDKKEEEMKASDESKNVEKCTVNTDSVDSEIEQLKKKKEDIQTQIKRAEASGKSDEEIDQLRQQLESVESELTTKDNDTYRKQHSTYTYE